MGCRAAGQRHERADRARPKAVYRTLEEQSFVRRAHGPLRSPGSPSRRALFKTKAPSDSTAKGCAVWACARTRQAHASYRQCRTGRTTWCCSRTPCDRVSKAVQLRGDAAGGSPFSDDRGSVLPCKRNGSTPPGQERRAPTPSGTTPGSWAATRGMARTSSRVPPTRWGRRNPTHGACTTSTATCGSGCRTGMASATTPTVHRWTRRAIRLEPRGGAEVVGTRPLRAGARLSAASTTRTTAASASAFDWRSPSHRRARSSK